MQLADPGWRTEKLESRSMAVCKASRRVNAKRWRALLAERTPPLDQKRSLEDLLLGSSYNLQAQVCNNVLVYANGCGVVASRLDVVVDLDVALVDLA